MPTSQDSDPEERAMIVCTVRHTRASAGAFALIVAAWACGRSDHSTPGGASNPDGSAVMSGSGSGGPSTGAVDGGGSSGARADGGGSSGAVSGGGDAARGDGGMQTAEAGNVGAGAGGGDGGC